jgi:hypothetical protein
LPSARNHKLARSEQAITLTGTRELGVSPQQRVCWIGIKRSITTL